MRLLRTVLLILVGLAIVLVAGAYILPRNVSVAREVTITAPPEKIFGLVNSLQATTQWSPWTGRDPAIKLTFQGPAQGVGNKMIWASEKRDVGNGTQEIVTSVANERVESTLNFDGMDGSKAAIALSPDEGGTRVVWSLDADVGMNPVGRWMGLMLDGMVGADYETGLANLKALAEAP